MSQSKQPSVRKNYVYRLFYEILILVTPLITAPYVSRVLGADGVGIYSYSSSIMTYFTMFAALGTVSYGAREIAQHRDDKQATSKLFFEIELMTVLTSSICIVVWIFVIVFSVNYRYYFLALLPLLFGTMFDISWFFTGLERVSFIVIRNSLCKLAGIVLLFLLVKEKDDLVLYIVINSVVTMVGNMSMWTYLPKFIQKVDIHTLSIKRHLRETLVYFVPTIATSIYTVLDKTLIGAITRDSYSNGYYEQATKIINIVKTGVFVAVNSVMGARISYLFSQEKYEEIHRRIGRSMDFIFLLGFGAVFGILGVADVFVPVFFGDGYEPVIGLLRLMTPLVLIIGISNCLGGQYYTPSGQRARSAKFIIAGSIVNLCMNLCMIPFWGAKGAVIGSLVAESVITVLYMAKCDSYLTVRQLLKYAWRRAIAGVGMFLIIMTMGRMMHMAAIVVLVAQIVVGIGSYFIILMIFRDALLIELVRMVLGKLKRKK